MDGKRETEVHAPQFVFIGEQGWQSIAVRRWASEQERTGLNPLLPVCVTLIRLPLLGAQFLLLQNRDRGIYPRIVKIK